MRDRKLEIGTYRSRVYLGLVEKVLSLTETNDPHNGVGRGAVVVTATLKWIKGKKPLTLYGISFLNAKSMGSIFTRKKLH